MFPVSQEVWCHILCLFPQMSSVQLSLMAHSTWHKFWLWLLPLCSGKQVIQRPSLFKNVTLLIIITSFPFVQDLLVAVKSTKNLLIYYWILMAHWIWSAATAVMTMSVFCGISSWLVLQILNSLDFCIINHQLLRKSSQRSLMWLGTEKRKHISDL